MSKHLVKRRTVLLWSLALAAPAAQAAGNPRITVHKSPSCGCCGLWVQHIERSGYPVTTVETDDLTPIKQKAGIPTELAACHTAFVDGYVIEGHVPAEAINRLLAERPAIKGIAVAGMPANSPGMPAPVAEPFSVMTIPREGAPKVFMDYPKGYGKS